MGGVNPAGKWGAAIETAKRLREVQENFADEVPPIRRRQLSEEIAGALAAIVPDERPLFLEALLDFFPSGHDSAAELSANGQADLVEDDPDGLVDRLVELAGRLDPDHRAILLRRVRDGGLSSDGEQDVERSLDRIRAEIGADPSAGADQPIHVDRALGLLAMMMPAFLSIAHVESSAWKDSLVRQAVQSPRGGSGQSYPMVMQTLAGRFLSGDEGAAQQLRQAIERSAKRACLLIDALAHAPDLAAKRDAALSPEQMEKSVNDALAADAAMTRWLRLLFGNRWREYWQRYRSIHGRRGPADEALREDIVQHVKNLEQRGARC